jgi:hypothetical protein
MGPADFPPGQPNLSGHHGHSILRSDYTDPADCLKIPGFFGVIFSGEGGIRNMLLGKTPLLKKYSISYGMGGRMQAEEPWEAGGF